MVTKAVKEFEVHPYVQFMMDRYDPYRRWLKNQDVPIHGGEYVPDVKTVELGWWERKGGNGCILSFSDQMVADGHIVEIAPGGQLKEQRHLYEEMVFVSEGRGATTVWYEDTPKHTFEWEKGALFAIPLNAKYQHFNSSGSQVVRLFSLTSAPVAFELFRDDDFIYNTNYAFKDRFDPDDKEYFSRPGQYLTEYYGGILHANFIPDIRAINLVPREKRGKGNRNMYIHMGSGSMFAHVSRFPVGTYKKAHRHGPGAHVYTLDSTGYTLMWNEGGTPETFPWHEGTVVSPAAGKWHQHYNTGDEPCRFVAFHASSAIQREEGGIEQIDFENEDPMMRKLYLEECAKSGVAVNM
ncbi:MAG: ethanolamine ammonia lyase-activating protein [Chloroflexi bacterium]|nr:ethanolamine ammonia lyase-activating protein [Chloroflexota bacterium]